MGEDSEMDEMFNVLNGNVKKYELAAAEHVQVKDKDDYPKAPRGPDAPPTKAEVDAHNLAHVTDAPRCGVCFDAEGKSDHHSMQTVEESEKQLPQAQMDHMFMTADLEECDEDKAKATVLSLVVKDQGIIWLGVQLSVRKERTTLRRNTL